MDITTARVEPHEIAKEEDFEFAFQSIIRNTAILDRMLTSAVLDYVAGGKVHAAGGMTFTVDPLWANGRAVDLPAYRDTVSAPQALAAPVTYPRLDIIQVRGAFQSYDTQRRAFWESELQVAQYQNIHVKNRLIVEIAVKQGEEGSPCAPEVDTGFVKIAEIYTEPGDTVLAQDRIANVSAMYQGEENPGWTNERDRTFCIGSISDIWESFDHEHYADGRHREAVIKAHNILLGVTNEALKGSVISVGENVNSGDLSLLAGKTLIEALAAIGQILQGDTANTLLKQLSMLLSWKSEETYQPYAPTFFQGRIYYTNPLNLPSAGQNPSTHPEKWINAAGDVVFLPPMDGRLYSMKNRAWTELNIGGDAVEALKFYSKKTIMFTNARIVDRRLRGCDLGLPYRSSNHEAYHFDTDNNNQNQQSNIVIAHNGEEPIRCGKDDTTEALSFESAVSDLVPYEMMGKSLYGEFSVAGMVAAQNSTLEMWVRLFVAENTVLLRLGTQAQGLITLHIGGADPEYSLADTGDIPYSVPDFIDNIPFSVAVASGNTLNYDWGEGNKTIDLDAAGIALNQRVWLHLALVLTADKIFFYLGENKLSFDRQRPAIDPLPFTINEGKELFNIDELSIIAGAAVDHEAFSENCHERLPYAALDYRQKYAVIMVDDPKKLRTNIFESPQFKAAVQAIINGS